jgi:acyl-coenzyme A synthetase/AMP-(fatty) acid ligase
VDAPEREGGSTPFRLALSGGSPLAPRLKREYRDLLGIPLCESYGQSEFGGFMALGRPDEVGERAQSGIVGPSLPDRPAYIAGPDNSELKFGEVGEVVVPWGYFVGYANKHEEYRKATAGGILHCGDLAIADREGRIKVLGRTGEREAALARGGFLRDAEDALYEHPEVRHGVVVQTDDGGIEAFVERRRSASTDAAGFNDFITEHVEPGLRPRRTSLLEVMPRTFSGKANRLILARQS